MNYLKTILFALVGLMFVPMSAHAIAVNWNANFTTNVLEPFPNLSTVLVKFPSLQATSTTATSTFAHKVAMGTTTPQQDTALEVEDSDEPAIISLVGAGSQTATALFRGESFNSLRGGGGTFWDRSNSVIWFWGSGYDGSSTGNDTFVVNRRGSATTWQFDAMNFTDPDVINALAIRANGNTGVGTSSPTALFTVGTSTNSTATTTVFMDSNATKGTCLVLKDVDGSGYTYVVAADGVLTASTASCR